LDKAEKALAQNKEIKQNSLRRWDSARKNTK